MSVAVLDRTQATMVGMGQIVVGRAPGKLGSILGSCIGVSLYHARRQCAALAHVILPDSQGRQPSAAGQFADTAIGQMLKLLSESGVSIRDLVAKIAGGAKMFDHGGPLQIGASNSEAVEKALAAAGIRIAARHLGGNQGRRIILDCATGDMAIEIAGSRVCVI